MTAEVARWRLASGEVVDLFEAQSPQAPTAAYSGSWSPERATLVRCMGDAPPAFVVGRAEGWSWESDGRRREPAIEWERERGSVFISQPSIKESTHLDEVKVEADDRLLARSPRRRCDGQAQIFAREDKSLGTQPRGMAPRG